MEVFFREGGGVEDGLDSCWRGGGEDFSGECGVTEVVEGETGAVSRGVLAVIFGNRGEVPAGDTGFEDYPLMSVRQATTVVYDDQGSIAASSQGGGDVDIAGTGITRVSQQFKESVLDIAQTPWTATSTFDARQTGEA